MIGLLLAAIAYARAYVVSRHRLALEMAALRQQLVVFKRKRPRPLLGNIDRLFWVTLRQWWSGWAVLGGLRPAKPHENGCGVEWLRLGAARSTTLNGAVEAVEMSDPERAPSRE